MNDPHQVEGGARADGGLTLSSAAEREHEGSMYTYNVRRLTVIDAFKGVITTSFQCLYSS